MSAMFNLVGGGLGVMPDPEDNPDGHVVPHHDAGTKITFEVLNVGDASGQARVRIEVDGVARDEEWESSFLAPGTEEVGEVSLGRLSEGSHSVDAFVDPGSGAQGHDSNTFSVE